MAGRPGTQFTRTTSTAPGSLPTDTGQAFAVGIAADGPIDEAVTVESLGEYEATFGDGSGTAQPLHDSVEAYFEEGGATLHVARVDDADAVVDADWTAALALFDRALGPGQVTAPGQTASARHGLVLNHVNANNRTAVLDMASGLSAAGLATAAAATSALNYADRGGMFADHLVIPQAVAGVDRTIPPSLVVAALAARSDAVRDPGEWPIGDWGLCRYARSAVTSYTDAERETLTAAGVNLFIDDGRGLRLYGFRTADVDTPELRNLGHQRLLMAIEAEALEVGERFVGLRITNDVIRRFHGQLEALLEGYARTGAFYTGTSGEEPGFAVITAAPVNTADTAADGELHADLQIRPATNAELVLKRAITVPVTQPVAA